MEKPVSQFPCFVTFFLGQTIEAEIEGDDEDVSAHEATGEVDEIDAPDDDQDPDEADHDPDVL